MLAATIPGPADPAPDLFRTHTLQDRDGDRARRATNSISSLRGARRVMLTCFFRNETPTGSPDDAVAQVGHGRGLEDANELKLGLPRLEAVE